jgi:hypothetical protein
MSGALSRSQLGRLSPASAKTKSRDSSETTWAAIWSACSLNDTESIASRSADTCDAGTSPHESRAFSRPKWRKARCFTRRGTAWLLSGNTSVWQRTQLETRCSSQERGYAVRANFNVAQCPKSGSPLAHSNPAVNRELGVETTSAKTSGTQTARSWSMTEGLRLDSAI